MKCENLQFNLPLYVDDILNDDEREQLDAHLDTCPVCRAKLADYQSLKNDLRFSAAPAMPVDLLYSVRNAVAVELNRTNPAPAQYFSSSFREWLQYRVMPYGVGIVTSVLLTFALLSTLLSTKEATQKGVEYAQLNSNRTLVTPIASNNMAMSTVTSEEFRPFDDSVLNLPISDKAPRLNPTGALLDLTESILRGKMKNGDVTVVADVFSNGIAKIAEVVEPPRDGHAMHELEKALTDDPSYAPFVPAKQDKRLSVVRVVLKIQRVDVDVVDKSPRPKTKYKRL